MSETQRIIKYLAMAFACFLVFSIVSGIMSFFVAFGNIFNDNEVTEKLEGLDIKDNVSILDIELHDVNLTIKIGDTLKAETNNKYIDVKQTDNKLFINQTKNNWFNNDTDELIIYVPTNLFFDGVSIETGAGKIKIDKLSSKKLDLEVGAGKVDINNLAVSEKAKIEGGAGTMNITNSRLNNLNLDMGVGKLSLTSIVTGESKIDAGVGSVDLKLIGTSEEYKINLDKGLGSTVVDGNNMADNSSYGSGGNIIDLSGGIGSIKVDFIN